MMVMVMVKMMVVVMMIMIMVKVVVVVMVVIMMVVMMMVMFVANEGDCLDGGGVDAGACNVGVDGGGVVNDEESWRRW